MLSGYKHLFGILPVLLLAMYAIQRYYIRTSRQIRYLDLESSAPLYSHLLGTIDGIATIRAFNWIPAFQETTLRLLDDSLKPDYFLYTIQCWLKLVLELLVGAIAVLLITLAVLAPAGTSAGAIALGMANILSLSQFMVSLVTLWASLEGSLGALERLKTFEASTPEERFTPEPQQLPFNWPSQGAVEVEKISASYVTGLSNQPALDKVTISIKPGEKVAICGRSGSGKTTFLMTLFRLLELDSGSISIDGNDISKIPHNALRSRLIAIPQEPVLFPGTVRTNVCPQNDLLETPVSDSHIISCLEKVQLWDLFRAQNGLSTNLFNLSLSQGQKQLLCLARALAQKSSSAVLILDEAMSSVDQQTEALMVKVLKEEFLHHTVLSVVHRLNTVQDYDWVVLLDKGKVVESGKPDSLLHEQGSQFRALWHGQS